MGFLGELFGLLSEKVTPSGNSNDDKEDLPMGVDWHEDDYDDDDDRPIQGMF